MSVAARHRALADPQRVRIVEELRAGPLDTGELAQRLGLHANTIRFHLALLRDAGLVDSHPARRPTPGRPRIVYSLGAGVMHDANGEQRLLATMLAGALASADDGPARAEGAGRAWGRYLVESPLPLVGTSDEQSQEEIVRLLEEHGFDPEGRAEGITMRRCPFHELAETHPHVVCAIHRGLIAGGLEQLGSSLELQELEVFPEPDVCIARLASRAGSTRRDAA